MANKSLAVGHNGWIPHPVRYDQSWHAWLRPLLGMALAALASSCTYGEVTWAGERRGNVAIKIWSCDGETWDALTASEGVTKGIYVIDGHSDHDLIVPEGPILLRSSIGFHERYDTRLQEYTKCPSSDDRYCSRQDIDWGPFEPLSGWEYRYFSQILESHNAEERARFDLLCSEAAGQ